MLNRMIFARMSNGFLKRAPAANCIPRNCLSTFRYRYAWAALSTGHLPLTYNFIGHSSSSIRNLATASSSKKKGSKTNPFEGKTPYEILNVSQNSSAQEIKLGYYKAAKLYHPDVVSEDERESAREKFQMVAAAYELLSDPAKRRAYDSGQSMWGRAAGTNANWQQQAQQANQSSSSYQQQQWWQNQTSYHSNSKADDMWEEMWDFTKEDRHVVEQAIRDYQDHVREEFLLALEHVEDGEYEQALNIAKAHRGLLLTIAVPVVAILRFPFLITAAFGFLLRFHKLLEFALLQALIFLKGECSRCEGFFL